MPTSPVVTIGTHNGASTLLIDGRPQPCTAYKITETPDTESMLAAAEAEIPGLARQGIRLCWVPVFIDWNGPGQYDFSDLDRRITTVLRLYDEHTPPGQEPALVVVRVQAAVFSPPWYVEQHLDANGRPTNLIEFRNPWGPAEQAPFRQELRFPTRWPDFSSTYAISPGDSFWDTHAIDALTAIVEHVRTQPWAHRVFGWLPCAFSTNEWFIFTDAPLATCDHSQPTQEAFGRHLREAGIAFEGDAVPPPDASKPRPELFLDPANNDDRRLEAFSDWLNERIAELIGRFVHTVREHYGPARKLVGVFYGYTAELCPIHHLATSGHLRIGTLLENPEVDFVCSPCQYRYRPDEGEFTYSQVLGPAAHSAALHGKLAILEDDHPPATVHKGDPGFHTRDDWHDEMFFRRNFAQVLCQGQSLWWYSIGAKWLAEAERQAMVSRMQRLADQAVSLDRSPVAEIAVVVDERSIAAMCPRVELMHTMILRSYAACYQLGAPFEFHELRSFLRHPEPERFKLVIFLNCFKADDEVRQLMGRLRGNGRTLLFQMAAGFIGGGAAGASELIGMALTEEPHAETLSVWVDPARSGLMPGGEDVRYGWLTGGSPVRPVLSVNDPAAEALGWLYTGNVGLARRRHDEWTAVYSAAPMLPAKVVREFAREAGVHLYCESGDVIFACRSALAVVAAANGEKRLTLPRPARLVDAFSGEEAAAGDQVRLDMKRHETRLFWVREETSDA